MCGIYRITNKINAKAYIGKSKNICVRWNEHYLMSCNKNLKHIEQDTSIIHKAIRKYGIENFVFEVLTLCDATSLDDEEKYFISYYNTIQPNGYNIQSGGDGGLEMHGSDNPNSKLNEAMVYDIREKYGQIIQKLIVYEDYKNIISINTFNDIWQGKTWKHIHMDVYTDENKKRQKNNYDKIANHKHFQVLSDEDILKIRDCKNDGLTKRFVHDTYYPDININTFSDIWYGNTFKHIISKHPVIAQKRHRSNDQTGCLNPSAKFTEQDIRNILLRKNNGETMKEVYNDFQNVTISCFRNVWNRKTYKNIEVENEYN